MDLRIVERLPSGTIKIVPVDNLTLAEGYLRTMKAKDPTSDLTLERFDEIDRDWTEWFSEWGECTNDLLGMNLFQKIEEAGDQLTGVSWRSSK